jgi:hypothetical protein
MQGLDQGTGKSLGGIYTIPGAGTPRTRMSAGEQRLSFDKSVAGLMSHGNFPEALHGQ